jgi:hypothetical protein
MTKILQFVKGFKAGMHEFGQTIAIIINSLLLLFIYLIGVGFTSLLAKLWDKRFLDTRISKREKTYWTELNLKKRPREEYYRQF